MTTRLAGKATHFLPFNRGFNGGAGNPPDPTGRRYRTAYLWEDVLARDSLLDLLAGFLHLETTGVYSDEGRKVNKETMVFPHDHQQKRRMESPSVTAKRFRWRGKPSQGVWGATPTGKPGL